MIGLGKLGLPVATAMASSGVEVWGYDPEVTGYPSDVNYERGFAETIARGRVSFRSLEDVARCPVVFVAVQTPHEPRFEGRTPLPEDRADFDYSHLRRAVMDLERAAQGPIVMAVISTVLPGTMDREVRPLLGDLRLVYNPSFIAMGTTISDFLEPEFVLLGGDDGTVREIYEACGIDRFYETTIPNAELIKVSYNTFIGLKIAFANTLMEVCEKTECDVDAVTGALKLADRRLISGAYLDGGMGDGGGCHPRDNIALSWLARELDLSYDLFEAAMVCRQRQAEWLCDLMEAEARRTGLDLGILGIAYKPGSAIETGSPARLVHCLLLNRAASRRIKIYDPHTEDFAGSQEPPAEPRVFLVGCKHAEFQSLKLPEGSVVIDPWRYMPDQDGVEVHRVGEGVSALPFDGQAGSSRGVPAPVARDD